MSLKDAKLQIKKVIDNPPKPILLPNGRKPKNLDMTEILKNIQNPGLKSLASSTGDIIQLVQEEEMTPEDAKVHLLGHKELIHLMVLDIKYSERAIVEKKN